MFLKTWFKLIVPWARFLKAWWSLESGGSSNNYVSTCIFFCSDNTSCSFDWPGMRKFWSNYIEFISFFHFLFEWKCFFSRFIFLFLAYRFFKNNRYHCIFWVFLIISMQALTFIFVDFLISNYNLSYLLLGLRSKVVMMKLNYITLFQIQQS